MCFLGSATKFKSLDILLIFFIKLVLSSDPAGLAIYSGQNAPLQMRRPGLRISITDYGRWLVVGGVPYLMNPEAKLNQSALISEKQNE